MESFCVVVDVLTHHLVAVFLLVAAFGEVAVFEHKLVFGRAADEYPPFIAENTSSLRMHDNAVSLEAAGNDLPSATLERHETQSAQHNEYGQQHDHHDDGGVAF